MTGETAANRLRRLAMRAARRGTREMDLILGPYAAARLAGMDAAALDAFEALLDQPDPDLTAWLTGREAAPPRLAALVAEVAAFAAARAAAARQAG